jgi:hypothetical protein
MGNMYSRFKTEMKMIATCRNQKKLVIEKTKVRNYKVYIS